MDYKIAFMGAGNMGGALVRAVCTATSPGDVIIYDIDVEKCNALSTETGCSIAKSPVELVSSAKFIVYCVKPQKFAEAVAQTSAMLLNSSEKGAEHIVVSIAAGLTIGTIDGMFEERGLTIPIVRIMPNINAAVGCGTLLTVCGETVGDASCDELKLLLSKCGSVELTDESTLDLASAISGCGPAFVFMFIEALADGGVEIGLPRDKAIVYAAQMVSGAAQMVLETGTHPGALKDAVCSPAGTTIAGVAVLEQNAFRGSVAAAVKASSGRNTELTKGS